MTEHLSPEQRTHYRQHTLPPEQIAEVYGHLEECSSCRASVESEIALPFGDFQTECLLGGWSDADHLTDEQQAAYVDNTLEGIERQLVDSHLECCHPCAQEIQQLRAFRAMLSTYPAQELSPSVPLSLKERIAAFFGPNTFRSMVSISGAAMAGALLFALFVHLPGRRRDESEAVKQIAARVTEAQTRLTQEQTRSKQEAENTRLAWNLVAQEQQKRIALESRQKQILQELAAARRVPRLTEPQIVLVTPPEDLLRRLHPGAVATAGGNDKKSFALESPQGRVLRTDRPRFAWTPRKGATHYRVTITPSDSQTIESAYDSGRITGTRWTINKPLPRGQTYQWAVTAMRGQEDMDVAPGPSDAPSVFYILSQEQARAVRDAERQKPPSPLGVGIAYLNAGLLDEAEKQFKIVLSHDPNSPVARKLQATIKALPSMR